MVIGIPWCRQEDYVAFCTMFEDSNNLPQSWGEFAQAAEKAEQFYRAQGEIVERVYLDPKIFPNWCTENSLRVDRSARLEFAYRMAIARHPDENSG